MKKTNRRTFLQSSAALASAAVIDPARAFGSEANSRIKLGVIGCGVAVVFAALLFCGCAHSSAGPVVSCWDLVNSKTFCCSKTLGSQVRCGMLGYPGD